MSSTNNKNDTDQQQQQHQQDALNAILDAALDELDDENDTVNKYDSYDHSEASAAESKNKDEGIETKQTKESPTEQDLLLKNMSLGVDSNDIDEAAAMLESFVKQLQSDLASELVEQEESGKKASTSTNSTNVPAGPPRPPPPPAAVSDSQVNSAIENLLENMAQTENENVPLEEDAAMLEEMMREFEKLMPNAGGSSNEADPTDTLMNGMMQQLLSKDLMYEPMKQVCDKFPSWLEENKETMSSDEYDRRCKQYQCFQDLVQIYETDPQNVERLMQLMESVQEYGQPPVEIVKEIAPGLELDEDGMPCGGGGGIMPPGSEECHIM